MFKYKETDMKTIFSTFLFPNFKQFGSEWFYKAKLYIKYN